MKNSGIAFGDLKNDVLKAVSLFGDPMMPSVAGLARGALSRSSRVLLAGGTQMTVIIAILKNLGVDLHGLCIGTTVYVARDRSSNIVDLVSQINGEVPVYASDLHLDKSSKPGLRAFANGYVKEGVGAGGISIAAMLKSNADINGFDLLKSIEKEYECTIEKKEFNG
jgi:NaMN:DMB phosphoribosyltransferase